MRTPRSRIRILFFPTLVVSVWMVGQFVGACGGNGTEDNPRKTMASNFATIHPSVDIEVDTNNGSRNLESMKTAWSPDLETRSVFKFKLPYNQVESARFKVRMRDASAHERHVLELRKLNSDKLKNGAKWDDVFKYTHYYRGTACTCHATGRPPASSQFYTVNSVLSPVIVSPTRTCVWGHQVVVRLADFTKVAVNLIAKASRLCRQVGGGQPPAGSACRS